MSVMMVMKENVWFNLAWADCRAVTIWPYRHDACRQRVDDGKFCLLDWTESGSHETENSVSA